MSKAQLSPRIYLITTSYNRKAVTVESLTNMINELNQFNLDYEVILVDGGSSDGTVEALKLLSSRVSVISAPGKYWAQCLSIGYKKISANIRKHDFLIIYNDDIKIFKNLGKDIKKFIDKRNLNQILVIPFCDPHTKQTTYGGLRKSASFYPLRFSSVALSLGFASCDTLNMNCCVIPGKITLEIELFPSAFIHNTADIYFGLQATALGYKIIQNFRYGGFCTRNSYIGTSQELGIGPQKRLLRSMSVKEQPIWQRYYFMSIHGGRLWVAWWLFYYVKKLFK